MNKISKLLPKVKLKKELIKIDEFPKLKVMNRKFKLKKNSTEESNNELNQSWDFTPFPKLFFPSEKKNAIRDINNLNFQNILNSNNPSIKHNKEIFNKFNSKTPHLCRNYSTSNMFQEIKGDITKHRPPAFSFGTAREDCKMPFFDFKEKISPSPGSYNLRPLCGLGGPSLKYSINKSTYLKNMNIIKNIGPGPGHYNIDKLDSKNNGNIILSNYPNSPISNFSKYTEKRGKNIMAHSEWNIKPDPTRYNVNSTVSMFNGNGKFPLSVFKSNISKSINKSNSFSKNANVYISPGPGHYNHYSIFMGPK